MRKPLKGFITYAHKDTEAKEELREYLAVMEQNKELVTWEDGQLTPGDEALQEGLLEKVADSDLLLYLVSAASLASKNCNRELTKALKQNIRIIPIILKHCDWLNHQVKGFEVLPHKGKPLNEWIPESKGWQNVVDGIRKVVESQSEFFQNVVREEVRAPVSETTPNNRFGELLSQQGSFFLMLGDTDRAIEAYSHAIDHNPENAAAYINRGNAYKDKGDLDNAIKDYSKAIELKPEYAAAYNNRGAAYGMIGEVDAAIKDLNKAIDVNPEDAQAYYNRGIAYANQRDFESAITDYSKAIELKPEYAEAYSNRSDAYRRKDYFDAAIKDSNKAIDLKPDLAAAYINRGNAYDDTGEVDAAIRDYNKAIELDPENANTYYNRGLAYRRKDYFDAAIQDFNKAIALDPEDAQAQQALYRAKVLQRGKK